MEKIGRNDPCRCGSGLKYKKCHMHLDNAKPTDTLEIEHSAYAKKWKVNSNCFEKQGCYKWMAEIATRDEPTILLDIGCGDGLGLKAILESSSNPNLRIISVDENLSCLREAEKTLTESGFSVELLNRTILNSKSNGTHTYTYTPIAPKTNSQITLLQSDILTDHDLLTSYLLSLGKVDAITVWLIGTHLERGKCEDIEHLSITSSGQYRLRVQNKAYELADLALKNHGILQIVDRGEVPTTDFLKQDFLNAHKHQASVTSLKVKELDYMLYEEPQVQTKIAMHNTVGTSGRLPDLTKTAMLSVIAHKL